jgi:thiopurine S-methyltransferase
MEKDFWLEKWTKGEIGFHQSEYNKQLLKALSLLKKEVISTVFVPLCGKSLDLLAIKEYGYKVIGVELSEMACIDFFKENKIAFEVSEDGEFKKFVGRDLTLYCGDFFKLTREHLKDISLIYDRAALIALPKKLRNQYIEHLMSIAPKKINYILINLDYGEMEIHQERLGPPFSVTQKEIDHLITPYFKTHQQISSKEMPCENPRVKAKGVDTWKVEAYLFEK